jgi:hypothetical protein
MLCLRKLPKENRRSDVSGSWDFGSSALRRLRVFGSQYFKLDIKTHAFWNPNGRESLIYDLLGGSLPLKIYLSVPTV